MDSPGRFLGMLFGEGEGMQYDAISTPFTNEQAGGGFAREEDKFDFVCSAFDKTSLCSNFDLTLVPEVSASVLAIWNSVFSAAFLAENLCILLHEAKLAAGSIFCGEFVDIFSSSSVSLD